MKLKQECIDTINSVLSSKKSSLSKKDRENLIVLREKIKNEKSYKGLFSLLKDLIKLSGYGYHFLGDT